MVDNIKINYGVLGAIWKTKRNNLNGDSGEYALLLLGRADLSREE